MEKIVVNKQQFRVKSLDRYELTIYQQRPSIRRFTFIFPRFFLENAIFSPGLKRETIVQCNLFYTYMKTQSALRNQNLRFKLCFTVSFVNTYLCRCSYLCSLYTLAGLPVPVFATSSITPLFRVKHGAKHTGSFAKNK